MNNSIAKVAVIIVTWKGMKWIDNCLAGIRKSTCSVTTFIVDNASPDETPDYIAQNYPEIRLTRSKENLGFGKANNIAIAQAYREGFDYFFLLNQDAYLQPYTVERLLQIASTNKYAIVSPMHLNGDGSHIDFYFRDFVIGKCPAYLDQTVTVKMTTIVSVVGIIIAKLFLQQKHLSIMTERLLWVIAPCIIVKLHSDTLCRIVLISTIASALSYKSKDVSSMTKSDFGLCIYLRANGGCFTTLLAIISRFFA